MFLTGALKLRRDRCSGRTWMETVPDNEKAPNIVLLNTDFSAHK